MKKKSAIKFTALIFASAGVLAFTSCKNEKNNDAGLDKLEQYEPKENTDNQYPTNATAEYLTYIERDMDMDNEQTEKINSKDALHKLIAAVQEKSEDLKTIPNEELDSLAENTSKGSEIKIDNFKHQAGLLTNQLELLQKDNFENLAGSIADLKEDLAEVSKSKEINYENEDIQNFFEDAADILEDMITDTPNGNVEASYISDDSLQYSQKPDTIEVKE
ncbi:hypothetical protein [Zunongwangia sp.]|uniref:hypothetical protein n=1 Tax=Zunongwangia sp. TaxID=1965325 RepID=UPI003AA86D94